ncbi:MAG: hypothetical protein JWN78_1483, partial [Bacteroidota bacterium]|nr:hypothetical protein [Bacteroidota bacterium]
IEEESKLKMIMDETHPCVNKIIPDPYFDNKCFIIVYVMLDKACDEIIKKYAK